MTCHPGAEYLVREPERLRHRRAVLRHRLEPDREFDRLIDQAARAVVHLLRPLLDPRRRVGDLADRHEMLPRQRPSEGGTDLLAIPDDADHVVVVDPLALAHLMTRFCSSRLIASATPCALLFPAPPPNGSSIDFDWSIRNRNALGLARLISAEYAIVSSTLSNR